MLQSRQNMSISAKKRCTKFEFDANVANTDIVYLRNGHSRVKICSANAPDRLSGRRGTGSDLTMAQAETYSAQRMTERQRKRHRSVKLMRKNWVLYLFLLPAVLYIGVFH